MNFKALCPECQDYLQVRCIDEENVEITCNCGIREHDDPYDVAAYLIFLSALEEGCYYLNKEYDIIKKYSRSELTDETIQKEVRNILKVDDAKDFFKEKIFGFPPVPFKVKTKRLLENYLDTNRINDILNDFSLSSVVNLKKIYVQEIIPAYDGFLVMKHHNATRVASLEGVYHNLAPDTINVMKYNTEKKIRYILFHELLHLILAKKKNENYLEESLIQSLTDNLVYCYENNYNFDFSLKGKKFIRSLYDNPVHHPVDEVIFREIVETTKFSHDITLNFFKDMIRECEGSAFSLVGYFPSIIHLVDWYFKNKDDLADHDLDWLSVRICLLELRPDYCDHLPLLY